MDKQQQILEMAKDICRVKLNCNDVCNPISACDALKYAERAVEAGYVKVVRCKDCIHYIPLPEQYNYSGKPAMHCVWHSRTMNANGYCDEARKKKGK